MVFLILVKEILEDLGLHLQPVNTREPGLISLRYLTSTTSHFTMVGPEMCIVKCFLLNFWPSVKGCRVTENEQMRKSVINMSAFSQLRVTESKASWQLTTLSCDKSCRWIVNTELWQNTVSVKINHRYMPPSGNTLQLPWEEMCCKFTPSTPTQY